MSRKTLGMISGRVRVADVGSLDSGRYEFLSLENAEPNPGAPSSNNGILGSATDGTRSWLIPNQGLSVSGSNDLFVDETGVPIDTTGYNYSTSNVLSDVLADLDQNIANATAGNLNSVATDSTLTGDGTSSNPLSVVATPDAETLDGQSPAYYLNYNNFTNTPTIGDGTITVSGGTGLSGTDSFSTNQTTNQTITLSNDDRGSSQNIFKNVAVSGQNTIVADSNNDTLNIVGGSSISVSTDSATDTLTIDFDGTDSDNYVDSVTFDSGTGDLTLGRTGTLGDLTTNLDGRYLLSGAKAADADLLDGNDSPFYLNYNNFTNTPTIGNGTLTVSGGSGLTGTGTFDANQTTNNTISLNHADTSTVSDLSPSTNTFVDALNFDTYGHVTGYSTSTAVSANDSTITISAGSGLTTGGSFSTNQSTDETITLDHADTSAQGSIDNSGGTVIQDVTLDGFGHVTGLNSVDLDTRYLQSYTETDTLDSVTTRGSSTTNAIDVGSLDVGAPGASSESINIDAPSGTPAYIKFWETGSFGMSFGYDGSGSGADNKLEIRNDGDATEFEFYNDGRLVANSFSGDGSNLTSVDAVTLGGQTSAYHLDYNNFNNTPTIGDGTLTVSGGSGLTGSGTFNANQSSNDSITLNHADTSSQGSVNNSGGTVVQDIDLDGYGHVTGLGSIDLDSRYYTQSTADSRYVNESGDTMTGFLTLHADPTNALHAATKRYVDDIAQGLNVLPSALVATTSDLNASYSTSNNTLTSNTAEAISVDGTSLSVGDNVLVKDQSNAYENGSYVVTTVGDGSTNWVLTRCDFCDETDEIPGSFEFVVNGSVNDSTGWVVTVPSDFELNNTNSSSDSGFSTRGDIVWTQFSGAGTYTAGNGLVLNGTEFSHNDTSSVSNLTASSRTYVDSLTFDTFGHVTGYTTSSETVVNTDTNDYVTSMSFNISTGVLTLTRTDSGTVTEDLDGRYLVQNATAADSNLLDGQDGTYYLNYNNFTNTPTIGNGTLTVSGGSGLTGSGTFDANQTTNNTVTIDHADTSTQGSSTNSGRTYIQSIGLDGYGHVTSLATATETVTDTNDYVSSMSFNTGTGVLTLTRTDSGTVTEDLDGRYLTSESDTIDSVTDRGSSTTNTIGVRGVSIDSSYDLDSDTGSTSSTTQTSVASFSSSTYGSAKLIVQISDSVTGERQISELLVAHDGTNAFATEYGVVYTGTAPLATFDADISSGDVRLLATAASANSTSYTVSETLMV